MIRRENQPFSAFSILITFLLFMLIGLALTPLLSVQLMPSTSYASVSVACRLYGASPKVTELELTTPIESTLEQLKGVQRIFSTSNQEYAYVTVELDKWTDPELFRFEAASQMRQLYAKLPPNASYPETFLNRPDNSGLDGSILAFTLTGPGSSSITADIAERNLRPLLSGIRGIYQLKISGLNPDRLSISTDFNRLRQLGLSYEDVRRSLNIGFLQEGLGMINTGEGKINLFIESGIISEEALKKYPLSNKNGRIIHLGEAADIKTEEAPVTSFYRINGKSPVILTIYPETHINTLRLVSGIKDVLKVAEKSLPEGYRLSLNYDKTIYIKAELNKIYFRTFLSIAILISFVVLITRQALYVFIVLASLAANVLLSFIFYYLLKLEIHLYSLTGITISLGLIIDNVIIIAEDIKHTGRNRIFAAILASTLTTFGALSVIFLIDDSQRINLFDFALAISINLLISLPVAYFFIPAMLEKFPLVVKKSKILFKRKRRLIKFNHFYNSQLYFMLRYRIGFFLVFVILFGLPIFMLPEKINKETFWAKTYNKISTNAFYLEKIREPMFNYLGGALYLFIRNQEKARPVAESKEENVSLHIEISMANGSTLFQMNDVVKNFEVYLQGFSKQLDMFVASIPSSTQANIIITFKKGFQSGFPYKFRELLETQSLQSGAADFQIYGVGPGFDNTVNLDEYNSTISLKGYSYNQLEEIARQMRDSLLLNQRVQDVLITSEGLYGQKTNYEYVLGITSDKRLSALGINRHSLDPVLSTVKVQRQPIGLLKDRDGNYMPVDFMNNLGMEPQIWATMNMPLQMKDSTTVRLKDITVISKLKLSGGIRRENQEYVLNVHYRFIGDYLLNNIIKKNIIKSTEKLLPVGYAVFGSNSFDWGWTNNAYRKYLWFIPLVLLIIYLICAVLLESLTQPIAVVLMIPFSFIGVFLTFYLTDLKFDEGAYASLLMLAGLVTNAALYIINDLNFINKRLKSIKIAITSRIYIKAFNAKAMPILVTTASAILSLLPFIINGEEKGFWFTLSTGTIGGLLFSLFGAYLILPLCLIGRRNRIIIRLESKKSIKYKKN